jgi:transcriptional regulator with XRE-family HTH domain
MSGRETIDLEDWPEVKYLITRLIETRKARGWSQTEAAQRAGTSQPYLADIEGGKVAVSLKMLSRLARAYELPLTHFTPDEVVNKSPSMPRRKTAVLS